MISVAPQMYPEREENQSAFVEEIRRFVPLSCTACEASAHPRAKAARCSAKEGKKK